MASTSAGALPVPKQEDGIGNLQLSAGLVDPLYEKCCQHPEGTVFFQRDLSNMQVAGTLGELMSVLQEMVDRHLMKIMTFEGEPCWKIRSREDAERSVVLEQFLQRNVLS